MQIKIRITWNNYSGCPKSNENWKIERKIIFADVDSSFLHGTVREAKSFVLSTQLTAHRIEKNFSAMQCFQIQSWSPSKLRRIPGNLLPFTDGIPKSPTRKDSVYDEYRWIGFKARAERIIQRRRFMRCSTVHAYLEKMIVNGLNYRNT